MFFARFVVMHSMFLVLLNPALLAANTAANTASNKHAINPTSKSANKVVTVEVALLAGGCFWGVEDLMRKLPGVKETETGYTGGFLPDATYDKVKKGNSGHAEAVRVVFDPAKTSYEKILNYFFRIHDPTTLNRQGNDIGSQYRSAIFYLSDNQRKVAEKVRAKVDETGFWKGKVVTEIVPAGDFYRAEDFHQKYLEKNPGGYTCHYERPFIFGK
jgi:methionine-S-sulfoxide reductase